MFADEESKMARNKYPELTVQRILDASMKLFFEKGYENTTIQDIVDELGDLSKGAIYHHFKSKEDIIQAVGDKVHEGVDFRTMYDSADNMTGREKIKQMILYSVKNADQRKLMKSAPTIMQNPKFLAMEVRESVSEFAPIIASYIEEGNKDGSLKVKYPAEAAEVLMLLANIWINPLVFAVDMDRFARKLGCIEQILNGTGLTIVDDEVREAILDMRKVLD